MKHILDEIDYLTTTSEGLELEEVIKDPNIKRAFIRSLEVIGEHAFSSGLTPTVFVMRSVAGRA